MSGPRLLAALLIASCSAAASWWLHRPAADLPVVDLQAGLPRTTGRFEGQDFALSERQYELLGSRSVLLREYQDGDGGPPVLLCVALAAGQRKVAHPPEICYQGQGWRILSQQTVARRLGGRERRVVRLHIARKDRGARQDREQIVYSWYRVGRNETPSYLRQQWLGLVEDLRRSGATSALLRFSTPLGAHGAASGEEQLTRFCDQVLPELEACLARAEENQALP